MENYKEFKKLLGDYGRNDCAVVTDYIIAAAEVTLFRCEQKSNRDPIPVFAEEIAKRFTPVSNLNKLVNGYHEWKGVELALSRVVITKGNVNHLMDYFNNEERAWVLDLCETFLDKLRNEVRSAARTRPVKLPLDSYIYVLVDKTLSGAQVAIQLGHFMYGLGNALAAVDNNSKTHNIVMCEATPEFLNSSYFYDYAKEIGIPGAQYYEVDFDNKVTVAGFDPVSGRDRKKFANLKLLKEV